jgi:hypothetical protein
MKYNYKEGDRVYHRTLGFGTVLEVARQHIPETLYTPATIETRVVTRLERPLRPGGSPCDIETLLPQDAIAAILTVESPVQ